MQSCPTSVLDGTTLATSARPTPLITVIVPVRNEERFIRATLQQLLGQDYDAECFEILVVDGESTDATASIVRDIARTHANVRLLHNPKRWSSAGRNLAVRASRGDIIVIVDGHCELEGQQYLTNLADAFFRSGADCIGRPQPLDVSEATTLQRAIAAGRASRLGHNPSSYIYTSVEQFVRPQSVAVAYRREVFDAIGLFDEAFDACEDVEFNHRVGQAGFRCYFTPKVIALYYPRSTLAGLFRQMMRYGRGRVRLLRKHTETFSVPCFMPAAFVAGVVLGPLAAWFSPWLALSYVSVLSTYLLVLLLASAAVAWQAREAKLLPWLPFVFASIHFGGGIGVLQEALFGIGRVGSSVQPEQSAEAIAGIVGQSSNLSERRAG